MKKITNLALKPFKLELQPVDVKWERNAFAKLYESRIHTKVTKSKNPAECIIFSKDRALQLHALLASYLEQVVTSAPAYVYVSNIKPIP